MTDQHPITPPRELVKEWIAEIWHEGTPVQVAQSDLHLANHAAQWGYDQRGEVNEAKLQKARDQELEGCIEVIESGRWFHNPVHRIAELRAARHPKPPSLKKQALEALDEAIFMADDDPPEGICSDQADIIRRALEALPDD